MYIVNKVRVAKKIDKENNHLETSWEEDMLTDDESVERIWVSMKPNIVNKKYLV